MPTRLNKTHIADDIRAATSPDALLAVYNEQIKPTSFKRGMNLLKWFCILCKNAYLCRMLRAFKCELRPTPEQATQLNGAMGSCRFIYNLALQTKIAAYQAGHSLSCFDLMKQLTELKEDLPWLKDVPSQSLQQAISNLDAAYTNFFKGRGSFPTYKKKTGRGSFRIPVAVKVDFENWTVQLPKYGKVAFNRDRKFEGTVRQATVSRTPTGRYFISILIETGVKAPAKKEIKDATTVGVDFGLKDFVVLSDGTRIAAPKFFVKSQRSLRVAQRSLARKQKGSKRMEQQKLAVAKLHEKVTNQRKDFLHKLSSEITNRYDTIALETLNVAGMIKNHCLSKAIADVSWSEFVSMLEYKAEWKGKNILRIGRFEPSSKTCTCGHINSELKLSDREWTCVRCGVVHDRDWLAAGNIKRFALSGLRTQPADANVVGCHMRSLQEPLRL